jgi:single-strand DNA-binding protein
MDINTITMVGNLTADPTVRTAESGTIVGKFRIASQRPQKNGEDDGADFINVTAFGQLATNCDRYLAKGRQVAVTGRLRFSEYETDDGRRQSYEITADTVQFLGGRQAEEASPEEIAEPAAAFAA